MINFQFPDGIENGIIRCAEAQHQLILAQLPLEALTLNVSCSVGTFAAGMATFWLPSGQPKQVLLCRESC